MTTIIYLAAAYIGLSLVWHTTRYVYWSSFSVTLSAVCSCVVLLALTLMFILHAAKVLPDTLALLLLIALAACRHLVMCAVAEIGDSPVHS